MEKYENLGLIGEGSYGLVYRCKHRDTGQIVAIKKFLETEDDKMVKKMALREIRTLKRLRHENLVNLVEVFRRKRRLFLVFEFVDHTVLEELENNSQGLGDVKVREYTWQILRGLRFCHQQSVLHRDIKPENVLVSRGGVVKLCDFGFARMVAAPGDSATDYVATRWYRAPELLVGDTKYGKEVDVWAIGCLFAEMLTGEALFPGDSDIDQLYQILQCMGKLSGKHEEMMTRNAMFQGVKLHTASPTPLSEMFPMWSPDTLGLASQCLMVDPSQRWTCEQLLQHEYFTHDNFPETFFPELKRRFMEEFSNNPLLPKRELVASARKPKLASLRSESTDSRGQKSELFLRSFESPDPKSQRDELILGVRGDEMDPPVVSSSKLFSPSPVKQCVISSPIPPISQGGPTEHTGLQSLMNNLTLGKDWHSSFLLTGPPPLRSGRLQKSPVNLWRKPSLPKQQEILLKNRRKPAIAKQLNLPKMKIGEDLLFPSVPGATGSPSKHLKKKGTPLIPPVTTISDPTHRGSASSSQSESLASPPSRNLPHV